MLINSDKFFVAELNERGYKCDYKTMVEIYRASRQRPDCETHRRRKARQEAMMAQIEEEMIRLEEEQGTSSKTRGPDKAN